MSKSPPPPLMAVFRSQLQGEILSQILLAPGRRTSSDLARALDAPFPTVRREVERLTAAGILRAERVGRSRLLEPNTESPAYRPLRDLVMVAFGPRQVVEEEFSGLDGLQGLYIYGSWAARYAGEPGPEPGDIDVLLVGSVDRDDAYDAAERAQYRLGREVNTTVASLARWTEATEPFLVELHRRPLVSIRDAAPARLDEADRDAGPRGDTARGRAVTRWAGTNEQENER